MAGVAKLKRDRTGTTLSVPGVVPTRITSEEQPTTPARQTAEFPPSLQVAFDASVHYGPDHARPDSGAIGFLMEEGMTVHLRRSERVPHLVSSTALEYRALLAAVRAVRERFDRVASLHIQGDADVVLDAVEQSVDFWPSGSIEQRRTRSIQQLIAPIHTVTYQRVPRELNERAHELAQAGHRC